MLECYECYEFEECEYNGQPKCYLPDGMECPHGVKAHKPTNADCIRAMSDEELAKFIATPCQCEVRPKRDGFRECGNDLCLQYLLKWLQQPCEGE